MAVGTLTRFVVCGKTWQVKYRTCTHCANTEYVLRAPILLRVDCAGEIKCCVLVEVKSYR